MATLDRIEILAQKSDRDLLIYTAARVDAITDRMESGAYPCRHDADISSFRKIRDYTVGAVKLIAAIVAVAGLFLSAISVIAS